MEQRIPKAMSNGAVIAEAGADAVEIVAGNVYFPVEAVNTTYLRRSQTHTICPWKGTASYYTIVVNEQENTDAA